MGRPTLLRDEKQGRGTTTRRDKKHRRTTTDNGEDNQSHKTAVWPRRRGVGEQRYEKGRTRRSKE